MFEVKKNDYNKSGHIPKSKKLSNFDTVYAYLRNVDKSNGNELSFAFAQIRNLFVGQILLKYFKFEKLPPLKEQYEFCFDNMVEFKKFVNIEIRKESKNV